MESNKNIARSKVENKKHLMALQEEYICDKDQESWEVLCEEYRRIMRNMMGWPPGKYRKTIEKHGVKFDDVTVINLAQCPIPGNQYTNEHLERCYRSWTQKLIKTLCPALIIAQGEKAFEILNGKPLPLGCMLVRGIHHANSPPSGADLILSAVRKSLLAQYGPVAVSQ